MQQPIESYYFAFSHVLHIGHIVRANKKRWFCVPFVELMILMRLYVLRCRSTNTTLKAFEFGFLPWITHNASWFKMASLLVNKWICTETSLIQTSAFYLMAIFHLIRWQELWIIMSVYRLSNVTYRYMDIISFANVVFLFRKVYYTLYTRCDLRNVWIWVFHFIQTWFILYCGNTRLLHSNTDILRYNQDIYSHFLGGIA
jgi:hypothetical protein